MKRLIFPALFILSVLACEAKSDEVTFSVEGEGYQCTLYERDFEDTQMSEGEAIQLLWKTNLYSDDHSDSVGQVTLLLNRDIRIFNQIGWDGNIFGSHHTFESLDGKQELRLSDDMHSPKELENANAYFFSGSILIINKTDPEDYYGYTVQGFCR